MNVRVNPGEANGYYLYFLGMYSEDEIDWIIANESKKCVIADVGGNTGFFALSLVRSLPEAVVYSFEPDPQLGERFRQNLLLNPGLAGRIRLIHAAAAEKEGTFAFASTAGTPNNAVGRLVGMDDPNAIRVAAMRLDDFFAGRNIFPDIVKIDVEGAELRVLQGMENLFRRGCPRRMMIEIHGFYRPQAEWAAFYGEIKGLLDRAGYRLSVLGRSGACPPPEEWPGRLHLLAEREIG